MLEGLAISIARLDYETILLFNWQYSNLFVWSNRCGRKIQNRFEYLRASIELHLDVGMRLWAMRRLWAWAHITKLTASAGDCPRSISVMGISFEPLIFAVPTDWIMSQYNRLWFMSWRLLVLMALPCADFKVNSSFSTELSKCTFDGCHLRNSVQIGFWMHQRPTSWVNLCNHVDDKMLERVAHSMRFIRWRQISEESHHELWTVLTMICSNSLKSNLLSELKNGPAADRKFETSHFVN